VREANAIGAWFSGYVGLRELIRNRRVNGRVGALIREAILLTMWRSVLSSLIFVSFGIFVVPVFLFRKKESGNSISGNLMFRMFRSPRNPADHRQDADLNSV